MNGRRSLEDCLHRFGIPVGDTTLVKVLPETLLEKKGTVEGTLHRELLIKQHPDQQSKAVAGEQAVGIVGIGEVESVGHTVERIALLFPRSAIRPSSRVSLPRSP